VFSFSNFLSAKGATAISSGNVCNEDSCSPTSTSSTSITFPTLSSSGSFNLNDLVDGSFKYTDWGLAKDNVISFSGSAAGTAVLYFDESITIPKNTSINSGGSAANVLIIVDGAISIAKDANINAFIYASGSISLAKDSNYEGAISAAGSLVSAKDNTFTSSEGVFESGNFCENDGSVSLPIVDYRFDECSYTGAEFEVVDQTGNYSAQSFSNLDTSDDAQIERAANLSDASHHIETSIPIDNEFSVSTWFKKPTADSGNIYLVLGAMDNDGGDLLYLDRDENYRWGVYDGTNSSDGTFEFGDLAIGWHHMVLAYGTTSTTLYIDGDNKGSVAVRPSGTIKYIGTSYDDIGTSSPQGFRTALDEFKVYDEELSSDDITELYTNELAKNNYDGTSRDAVVCEVIHHFEINHDAQGLTCVAEPLTIKACSDAGCTKTIATPTDVQIFANGVLKTTVTVAGETATDFNHLVEETITLSSDQTYTCNNGGDTSCDIIFLNAGFLLDVNSSSDVSSCESVNFEIKAVKLSDSGVSCAPAFTGSQALDFSFSYSNPSAGTILPVLNGTNMATSGASETRSIVFDVNGEASLPIEYHDAGSLSFTISENVSSGVSSSTINKDFYPSKIVVTAEKNDGTLLNNATSDGTPKQVAADSFTLKYSGQCNDNTETLNYQPQSSNAVELAVRHILPSSLTSVSGDLTVEGTLINATDSINTNWQSINTTEKELIASYDEVGVINISVKDTDYLGNSVNSSGFIDVGRFYPSYFDVSVTHNSFQNASSLDGTPFTYVGMPFGYSSEPILTITAKNYLGDTTENYTETSFQKLTEANVIRSFPSADTTKDGVDTITKMVVESTPVDGVISKLSNGVMDYTFSNTDTYTYSKDANSEVSEFTVNYDILISSITDSDGVAINVDTTLPLTVQPTEGVQRFGRLVLENSFGSENSSLAQSFEVEFLNTSGVYQRNADDDFSVISNIATNWSYSNATDNILISDLLLSGNDGSFSSGQIKNIELSSGGNQGTIDIEYTTPTWLQYNWSGKVSNLHDEDANATATFGVYRGNDRIISWREVGN
jgi:MSHA biogenesis protein MshQ